MHLYVRNNEELTRAMSDIEPGGVVVLDGVFDPVLWNADGSDDRNIVLRSDTGRPRAVFRSDDSTPAFEFAGSKRQNIRLVDIDFEGGPASEVGVKMVGDKDDTDNRHRNISLIGCKIKGFRLGLQLMRFRSVDITQCHVSDCMTRKANGHAHGAFLSDFEGCRISNCVFESCGLDPFREDGRNILSHGVYSKAGKPGEKIAGFIVRENVFYDCGSWSLTFSTEDTDPGAINGVTVYRNDFIGSANGIVSGGAEGSAMGIRIASNRFIDLGRSPSGIPQAFGIELNTTVSESAASVLSNRFYGINEDLPLTATVEAFIGKAKFKENYLDKDWL